MAQLATMPMRNVTHPAGSGIDRRSWRCLRPEQLLAIAHGLVPTALQWPGVSDPQERRWSLIASPEGLEAFVIAWPAGGFIELHDHGAASGAIVVAQGTLTEMSVRLDSEGRSAAATRTLHTGSHVAFGPGRVHDVVNRGPRPAVSVHVYAPRLASMTYYTRSTDGSLVTLRSERFEPGTSMP